MLQETHENNLKCRRVTFHALKSLSNAEESLFKTNICMEKVHQNKPHAIALRCFDIATKVLLYEIFLWRTALDLRIVIGCFATSLILGRTHKTSLKQMKSLDSRDIKLFVFKKSNRNEIFDDKSF